MSNTILCVFILCALSLNVGQAEDLRWDTLIFTQEWGYSACRQFKDKSSVEKKCRFEDKPSVWSVHGIWPTMGDSKGPNFCQKVKFDIAALTPIIKDLDQYWYEIDESKDAHHFWEHEWLKHGSCAMESATFNTELRYFTEGLSLRNKLDLYSILKSGGIIPSNAKGYMLSDIQSVFKKAIGSESAVPYVQCLRVKNPETNVKEYHILQFEICLDPQLNVKSCDAKKRTMRIREAISENKEAKEIRDQAEPCPVSEIIWYNDYKSGTNSKVFKTPKTSEDEL